MKRNWFCFLLVIGLLFTLSCGNSPRHLQSISIAKSVTGPQIQFVASGTFSAPPTAVTPLPVDWMLGVPAPPPKQWTYILTGQPYTYDCANANPINPNGVTAVAPMDPKAPTSGTTTKVVMATLPFSCQ